MVYKLYYAYIAWSFAVTGGRGASEDPPGGGGSTDSLKGSTHALDLGGASSGDRAREALLKPQAAESMERGDSGGGGGEASVGVSRGVTGVASPLQVEGGGGGDGGSDDRASAHWIGGGFEEDERDASEYASEAHNQRLSKRGDEGTDARGSTAVGSVAF